MDEVERLVPVLEVRQAQIFWALGAALILQMQIYR